MNNVINEINQRLENILSQYPDSKVKEAMYYSLKAGGKRIRPLIVLQVIRAYGLDYRKYIDIACALEMIHTYSLIHDDLPGMDNDDLRRGKPTCHKQFGEATAILAGDGLLNEAVNIILQTNLDDSLKLSLVSCLYTSSGINGMILGQEYDIENEDKKLSKETLDKIHHYKTGKLLSCAFQMGALIASPNDLEILKQISCVLVNTITMSDALAKVPEVLNFTEEKIIDILSDNHKVLGFFANNDLEEVKRKGEAIFSAITTSNVYQVEWAVLVLELIDWVRRYQYLISDRAKNILYSTVLEPVPYLNVVAGRELHPDNPNNSCLLLKKMGTDSGKVLYAGTMVKIDKRSLVSLWYINDAAIEKFAKCLVDAINMAKKWLDKTEGEFILDPDYYGII